METDIWFYLTVLGVLAILSTRTVGQQERLCKLYLVISEQLQVNTKAVVYVSGDGMWLAPALTEVLTPGSVRSVSLNNVASSRGIFCDLQLHWTRGDPTLVAHLLWVIMESCDMRKENYTYVFDSVIRTKISRYLLVDPGKGGEWSAWSQCSEENIRTRKYCTTPHTKCSSTRSLCTDGLLESKGCTSTVPTTSFKPVQSTTPHGNYSSQSATVTYFSDSSTQLKGSISVHASAHPREVINSDPPPDVAIIAGAAVGGLVLLSTIVALTCLLIYYKRRKCNASAKDKGIDATALELTAPADSISNGHDSEPDIKQDLGSEYYNVNCTGIVLPSLSVGMDRPPNTEHNCIVFDNKGNTNSNVASRFSSMYEDLEGSVTKSGKEYVLYDGIRDEITPREKDSTLEIYNEIDTNMLDKTRKQEGYGYKDYDEIDYLRHSDVYAHPDEIYGDYPTTTTAARSVVPIFAPNTTHHTVGDDDYAEVIRVKLPDIDDSGDISNHINGNVAVINDSCHGDQYDYCEGNYPILSTTDGISNNTFITNATAVNCEYATVIKKKHDENDKTHVAVNIDEDIDYATMTTNDKDPQYQHFGEKPVTSVTDSTQQDYDHVTMQAINTPGVADTDSKDIYDKLNDNVARPGSTGNGNPYDHLNGNSLIAATTNDISADTVFPNGATVNEDYSEV